MKDKIVTIKNPEDKLWFGLHKNKSINEIIEKDPQYIYWMHTNTRIHLSKKLWTDFLNTHEDMLKK